MIDTQPQTTDLAALDFMPSLPCEHEQHYSMHGPGRASLYVRYTCPAGCGHRDFLVCAAGWEMFGEYPNRCGTCSADATRAGCFTLLRKVRDS